MPPEEQAGLVTPEAAAAPATTEQQTPAATPANVAPQPADTPTDGEEQKEAGQKTFTQAELDEILQKRIAKAEAKAERRVLKALERIAPAAAPSQPSQQQQPAAPAAAQDDAGRPKVEQFKTVEEYVEALTDWKLSQTLTQRDQKAAHERQETQAKSLAAKTESIYAEAEKIEGFDRDEFEALPLTAPIAAAIVDSDAPAKLMAHLAANPAEVERIAALSPARQAAEIGKLEARISAAPPKTSKAPPPITPIGTRGGSAATDVSKMSMEEYAEYRKKQGANWARR